MADSDGRDLRLRTYWDRQAVTYDQRMAFAERRFFGDTRAWLCRQAVGEVLALCAIPDESRALAEMDRVLRPGGLLLLTDHVAASSWPVRVVQAAADLVSVPLQGEHFRRRPLPRVTAMGFAVERHDRFKLGVIERFAARKPAR
ncbi:hypothetical protein GCM10010149_72770 [Nonomuraea roseoviolacea subsp. roseoviolacea]|uniref:hypothetical protein n=1 Tax=Nonomuraea roseoviolacea TaxID=103837 RepID=UPI0031D22B6D